MDNLANSSSSSDSSKISSRRTSASISHEKAVTKKAHKIRADSIMKRAKALLATRRTLDMRRPYFGHKMKEADILDMYLRKEKEVEELKKKDEELKELKKQLASKERELSELKAKSQNDSDLLIRTRQVLEAHARTLNFMGFVNPPAFPLN